MFNTGTDAERNQELGTRALEAPHQQQRTNLASRKFRLHANNMLENRSEMAQEVTEEQTRKFDLGIWSNNKQELNYYSRSSTPKSSGHTMPFHTSKTGNSLC